MKRFDVSILMIGLLLAFPWLSHPAAAERLVVQSHPILLDPDHPDRTSVGALVYRGGLILTSKESRFGGFSALGISADGTRMVSLSDRGHRLSAHLVYDAKGHLTGLERPDLSSLAGLDGRTLQSKKESDIESMSPGVEGEIIVSFERHHRLWRYLPGQVRPEPLPPPENIDKLKKNSGIEALTLLEDGRLLALSEGSKKTGNAIGWVSDTAGWSPLTYKTNDGFRVTGATTHPNGDVFILERFYTLRDGVAARIKRLRPDQIQPGAELDGIQIAELRLPMAVDNFEGIDIRETADKRTFLYLISDDNFSMLQSTLLLMFEVKP